MTKLQVGIPCPSDRPDMESVARGIAVLERADCEVHLGAELLSRPPRSSPYAREEERAAELKAMMADPSLDVVWCADGGVGSYRLLPRMEELYAACAQGTPLNPLIGFSDITFLLWQAAKWGHFGYYGPTVACGDDQDAEDLEKAVLQLRGEKRTGLRQEYADVVRPGTAKGMLLAGTFSVVSQILGTRYCPSLANSVLMLEEHGWNTPGEHEYLFWFLMQRIELAGSFDGVNGLAFGEVQSEGPYAECNGPWMPFPDLYTIMEQGFPAGVPRRPLVAGLPWGRSKMGLLIPLGVQASLDVQDGVCDLQWEETTTWSH